MIFLLAVLFATMARSAGLAGDLQGLSDVEAADSESADELLEEGNAFEAGIVTGVEDAERTTPSGVHTHESVGREESRPCVRKRRLWFLFEPSGGGDSTGH